MQAKLWTGLAIVALASVLSACSENGVGSMSRQPGPAMTTQGNNASITGHSGTAADPGSPIGRE